MAAALSTGWMVVLGYGTGMVLAFVLSLLVFWRHRENIARIKAGTEPKIGQKG